MANKVRPVNIQIRVTKEINDVIEKRAEASNRTVSQYLFLLLKEKFENEASA